MPINCKMEHNECLIRTSRTAFQETRKLNVDTISWLLDSSSFLSHA